MHYSNSVSYKFKMNTTVNSITNNFTNCIVHAKQSENTHIEISLKKIIYPNARTGGVLSITVTVVFNGNMLQWFSEMSKMMYNWSPKQNV